MCGVIGARQRDAAQAVVFDPGVRLGDAVRWRDAGREVVDGLDAGQGSVELLLRHLPSHRLQLAPERPLELGLELQSAAQREGGVVVVVRRLADRAEGGGRLGESIS